MASAPVVTARFLCRDSDKFCNSKVIDCSKLRLTAKNSLLQADVHFEAHNFHWAYMLTHILQLITHIWHLITHILLLITHYWHLISHILRMITHNWHLITHIWPMITQTWQLISCVYFTLTGCLKHMYTMHESSLGITIPNSPNRFYQRAHCHLKAKTTFFCSLCIPVTYRFLKKL